MPETVEADENLLEAADQMLPDTFNRHARKWSDEKLVEAGLDPLERQRRAREAKLWVDKDTGLGVVMAKLPAPPVRTAPPGHRQPLQVSPPPRRRRRPRTR